MTHIFRIFILISSLFSNSLLASAPDGWIAIPSESPIVFSWIKDIKDKNLDSRPSIMLQKHPLKEKWSKEIKTLSKISNDCYFRSSDQNEWKQEFCLKNNMIYILMWNTSSLDSSNELRLARERLKLK